MEPRKVYRRIGTPDLPVATYRIKAGEDMKCMSHYHKETEKAIKEVKDYFERALADALNLTRVSAPLFVKPESGLNDNLNGVERPVSFVASKYKGKFPITVAIPIIA